MSLSGLRVALLEARRSSELARLVQLRGGLPYCVPAVKEAPVGRAEEIAALVSELARKPDPVVVASTGVGVTMLFERAEALGLGSPLRAALQRCTLVCRGPKPAAALQRQGLAATRNAREPYTTRELLEALGTLPLAGRLCLLLHHGERNVPLVEELARREAQLRELLLYEWTLPDDTGPVRRLVEEIIEGRIGAVAFTSQVQVRHLLEVASACGRLEPLVEALRSKTLTAAVGPTCAAALEEVGVPPAVVPRRPKMGAMIAGLEQVAAGTEGRP